MLYCTACKQYAQQDGPIAYREGDICPNCGQSRLKEESSAGSFNVNLGDANAISGGVNLSDSHDDNSKHFDQRGQTNYNAQGDITITNQAAQTTEHDVVLKKEDRYRAACRRVYEDFVIDDVELKQLNGLAQDLGLSDDRALSILNGVKQQMDAERAREEALTPRAQKRLQRLLSSMRENDVDVVIEQLESFDEMVTEKNISELHFVYYLAQAALNHSKCIALSEKSITDSYWRSYWSYVAYIKNGNKKEATRILDRIEEKFSDYSVDNTALLEAVGELMLGNRKAAEKAFFFDVNESKLSPRLQRLFEALLLILDPAEAKENNLREKDYLFYIKHIFNCETTEEREKREREEQKAREAEERRLKAEAEAKRKAEERARIKAEQEAQRKREEEERKRKEAEAKRKAEERARIKAEQEAQRKREEEERKRKEAEEKRKAEEERLRKEAEAKRKREEEARRRAAEIEAKRKAEEEARRKAAEEARRKEEAERKRKEEEAKRRREEEYRKRMEEARAKAELEAKRRAEDKSTITVSKTSLTFSADGGSETIEINASGFWQLSAVPDNWAIVEERTNSIVIKVLKNEAEKVRTDYLKIKCGYKEARVDIKQEANEKKTYVLKITKVTNMMLAMATARAAFGWDVGTSRTKFTKLPLTVKMENKQEALNLYNKLSNGGMDVSASSVTITGKTINNCF